MLEQFDRILAHGERELTELSRMSSLLLKTICMTLTRPYSVFLTNEPFCKEHIKNLDHFLLDCNENFDSIWCNVELKIIRSNRTDGIQIATFIKKLDLLNAISGWSCTIL